MNATTPQGSSSRLPSSTVRLARALVNDARRRGTRESSRVEEVAKTPLPDDATG